MPPPSSAAPGGDRARIVVGLRRAQARFGQRHAGADARGQRRRARRRVDQQDAPERGAVRRLIGQVGAEQAGDEPDVEPDERARREVEDARRPEDALGRVVRSLGTWTSVVARRQVPSIASFGSLSGCAIRLLPRRSVRLPVAPSPASARRRPCRRAPRSGSASPARRWAPSWPSGCRRSGRSPDRAGCRRRRSAAGCRSAGGRDLLPAGSSPRPWRRCSSSPAAR